MRIEQSAADTDLVTMPEFGMNESIGLDQLEHAADLISQADALIVAAGAGMGVDSGLPDFRMYGYTAELDRLNDANPSVIKMLRQAVAAQPKR
jgi:hypothetical protein